MRGNLLRWSAAIMLAAALGGCKDTGSPASAEKTDHPSAGAGADSSPPAGRSAQPATAISQDRLQSALLPSFRRLTQVASDTGTYESLPGADVAASVQTLPPGASVKPAKCRSALWSGPDPQRFQKATAAVVALRESGDTSADGIQAWDELAAADGRSRQAALGTGPVAGCGEVKATYQGNTLTFAEKPSPSLGTDSRSALLTPSSPNSRPTWLVTFVGNGYVGVVFMQGAVTKAQLDAFASAAYRTARQKLG